ncbi:DUF995 domain-containing protein [Aliiruegeria lutimaris]|uniref:DUF995 domain-containing protein n=1 Tax=Aliiruegeria lutimaris TaxID=571298 RepID=A0A1G8VD52_9RHOB|nr:DUF995 domain-containing protein [Aliiruegeria lutimaris]SDJ64042.1 Protein of unknown function [Aliiruegeria lutimaris]
MLDIQESRQHRIRAPGGVDVGSLTEVSAFHTTKLMLASFILAALVVPTVVRSDGFPGPPIPPDAVAPAPEELFRLFANHTEDWGRGSGKFWAPDGTWRAVNISEKSVGSGTWYVTTASRVCYEGNWYWNQDFDVANSGSQKTCTRFRRDAKGMMWSTTKGLNGPWYPFSFESFEYGNLIARSYAKTAAPITRVQQ